MTPLKRTFPPLDLMAPIPFFNEVEEEAMRAAEELAYGPEQNGEE